MSQVKMLEFAPWEPDQPAYQSDKAVDALNCIPAKRGYRSFPSAVVDALLAAAPSRIRGAACLRDMTGLSRTFIGTDTGLYYPLNGTWVQLGTGYTVGPENFWKMTAYGNNVFATNGSDAMQYASISGGSVGSFSALTGAPKCRTIAVIRDFLVAGGLYDTPNGIQWSGIDNPVYWPTPGTTAAQTAQADSQSFVGGRVQAVVPGWAGTDGIVFLDQAVYRMQYIGPPFIFQMTAIDNSIGTPAPLSPVVSGTRCYYLATDGWTVTDGATTNGLGEERVNNWFQAACDPARISEVRGAVDPINMLAVWSFPTTAAAQGMHDHLLVYEYAVDKWSHVQLASEFIWQDRSTSRSLESLNTYGTLESVPYPLDSPLWKGGALSLSIADSSHQINRLAGMPMQAQFDSAEFGGSRMMVQGFRPIVDMASPSCALLWRDLQGSAPSPTAYAAPSAFDGICYLRQSCRYGRARVQIPGGAAWNNAVGVELVYDDEGTL